MENFTPVITLNKIYNHLKAKYGDKQGEKLYTVAMRLVNPNQNTIALITSSGVTVKKRNRFIFKPFGNTDVNPKRWILYKDIDVTDQY